MAPPRDLLKSRYTIHSWYNSATLQLIVADGLVDVFICPLHFRERNRDANGPTSDFFTNCFLIPSFGDLLMTGYDITTLAFCDDLV